MDMQVAIHLTGPYNQLALFPPTKGVRPTPATTNIITSVSGSNGAARRSLHIVARIRVGSRSHATLAS